MGYLKWQRSLEENTDLGPTREQRTWEGREEKEAAAWVSSAEV